MRQPFTTGSFEVRTFGNPNLQAETSYSYYAGAIWTPGSADPDHSWWGWANGFTAYVDWSEITQRTPSKAMTLHLPIRSVAISTSNWKKDSNSSNKLSYR